MNCAVVTIGGRGGRRHFDEDDTSGLDNSTDNTLTPRAGLSGPTIFLANIGNGCATVDSKDVVFPSPGSVVQYGGNSALRASPTGTCNGQKFTGGGITGGDSGSNSMPSDNNDPSAHRGDCGFWASQGYLCSGSPSEAIDSSIPLLLLTFGLMAFLVMH
jgi:hypothetical protein